MHLTNYAIQKHSNNFVREDEEAGTKRRITTVNCWLIEHGYDVDKVSRPNYHNLFTQFTMLHLNVSDFFFPLKFHVFYTHFLYACILVLNT